MNRNTFLSLVAVGCLLGGLGAQRGLDFERAKTVALTKEAADARVEAAQARLDAARRLALFNEAVAKGAREYARGLKDGADGVSCVKEGPSAPHVIMWDAINTGAAAAPAPAKPPPALPARFRARQHGGALYGPKANCKPTRNRNVWACQ